MEGEPMETDFPAAHSMDTCWFAVDGDGHVAFFGSGEAGAVPFDASLEEPYAVLQELSQTLPQTEVLYNFAGQLPPGPLGARGEHWSVAIQDTPEALFFLTSLEPIRAEIASGQAVQVRATGGAVAVIITNLTRPLVQRIHDASACLGCFFHYIPDPGDDMPQPAGHGLFEYHHLCENWISGPYGLKEVPDRPVHVDQLPPRLREAVGQFRFPSLCFARAPHIQPIEHDTCISWEPAYLTGDGLTIRPHTKNEIDPQMSYAEVYRDWTGQGREWLAGIHIEPPAEPDADK
jgi:hypothetical protein